MDVPKSAPPEYRPESKRVLELRQTSSLTGQTNTSRIIIILPSTRYEAHIKRGWADVTDQVTENEAAALPLPSWFDGA